VPPPRVRLVAGSLAASQADVVATAVRRVDGTPRVSEAATELVSTLGADVGLALERASATGDAGQVVEVPRPRRGAGPDRVLLVGVGNGSPLALRRAGAALARRARGAEVLSTDILAGLDGEGARAVVEGLLLAAYVFPRRGGRGVASPFRV
jgi:leucyl aminopeptidase